MVWYCCGEVGEDFVYRSYEVYMHPGQGLLSLFLSLPANWHMHTSIPPVLFRRHLWFLIRIKSKPVTAKKLKWYLYLPFYMEFCPSI